MNEHDIMTILSGLAKALEEKDNDIIILRFNLDAEKATNEKLKNENEELKKANEALEAERKRLSHLLSPVVGDWVDET